MLKIKLSMREEGPPRVSLGEKKKKNLKVIRSVVLTGNIGFKGCRDIC